MPKNERGWDSDPVGDIRRKIEKEGTPHVIMLMINRFVTYWDPENSFSEGSGKTTKIRKLFEMLVENRYKPGVDLLCKKFQFDMFTREIETIIRQADLEALTCLLDVGMSPDLRLEKDILLKMAIKSKGKGYQGFYI